MSQLRRRIRPVIALVVLFLLLGGLGAAAGFASPASPQFDEWDTLNLINRERRQAGMPPLAMVSGARDVARAWSAVMAADGVLRHNPDMTKQLAERFTDWRRTGENVGVGANVTQLHSAFMASPGHRANVLGDYAYAGVGAKWAGDRLWITVNFLKTAAPTAWITRTPVTRVAGASDADTAVAVSRLRPAGSADGVALARADVFADALAGGPLATVHNGPVLLTPPESAPANVVEEMRRVLKPGGTVFLLGGPAAIAPVVEAQLAQAGLRVERLAGADRFSTATAIAPRVATAPSEVFLVSGVVFPDAVVSGAAAGARRAPILLVAPSAVPEPTAAYLAVRRPATRIIVGGTAVVSDAVSRQAGATERVAGADRYATSVAVANRFFPTTNRVAVAPGQRFADALAASPEAARNGMPVVLTASPASNPTYDYVGAQANRWVSALVVGRAGDVSDAAVIILFS